MHVKHIVICCSFFSCLVFGSSKSTLRLVNVVYRHGDRSPVGAYPTDPYKEDTWPQGFGQLSLRGMQQQYELGSFFHRKYMVENPLLNSSYIRFQIHIQSTDVDRTLMSAETDLAALYPPSDKQVWNPKIPWQPIPVHTMPRSEDFWLNEESNCPEYDSLLNKSMENGEYVKMSKKYEQFLADVNKYSGFNGTINIRNLFLVSDPLKIERENNLTNPPWVTDDFRANLTLLTNYSMGFLFSSEGKSRLRGGALLGQILENIHKYLNSTVSEKQIKFYMYSSHDTTLVALSSALGVWDGFAPPYAAAMGIELWEDDKKQYSIKMWYRNDTNMKDPYDLQLKDCALDCPLQKFETLTEKVAISPDNIRNECGLDIEYSYLIPMIIGIALAILLVVLVSGYCVCSIGKGSSIQHRILINEERA